MRENGDGSDNVVTTAGRVRACVLPVGFVRSLTKVAVMNQRNSGGRFLYCAGLMLCACVAASADAQDEASIATAPPALARTAELGRAALAELRSEDIEEAFSLLGQAADLPLPAGNRFDDSLSAAVGGINRVLVQMRSGRRFDTLHDWTFPSGSRKAVRVLTSLVPETAPPPEFARALGERPKRDSFPIASVGSMQGIFCSAWTLVIAADEEGSLRSLITELDGLAADGIPNAKYVLLLAQLRDSRSNDDELKGSLKTILENADALPIPAERSSAVLVAAAMQRDNLGSLAEEIVEGLNKFDLTNGSSSFVPLLRRLRATVILKNRAAKTSPRDLFYTTPSMWVSADSQLRSGGATGADEAIWLTHEDHVKRLAGPGDDTLLLRYPLAGTFELKGEVAELEHGGGGLTFGGMAFDANSKEFTLQEVQRPHFEKRVWPFVAPKEHRMFNRVNIRSDGETITFLSNLHPGWRGTAESCASSPWLGLRAFGHGRVIFRNLELVGTPTIPREVKLIGDDLRGWSSSYGEAMTRILEPFPTIEATPSTADPVWHLADGVIHGEASAESPEGKIGQSHLVYMRPCLAGETVTYEFFYHENKTTAHPVVGRLAFLMEPTGVRLHWLTDNANEWTCLPEDNAIIEPLSRRGPAKLPLKSGEWNSVTMTFTGDEVSVSLNGEEVYLRSLEDVSGRHFGIYHDRNQTSVKVRNVVLSGDWPQKLSAEQLGDLVALP